MTEIMDFSSSTFWLSLLQIIWIDLLLSGDNAVVIALACRSLPENRRNLGIWLGAGAAVGLRIIFALVVTYLLAVPYLKVIGGILLFWIAIKLAKGEEEAHNEIEASDNLWKAVRTIAIADAVMSLDNVIAIAGAAKGHPGFLHLRPVALDPADHHGRAAADLDHRALPDPGLARGGLARLDRG